jgi:hypothetical protein
MLGAEYSREYGSLAARNAFAKYQSEASSQSLTLRMLVTAMGRVQNCNHFAEPTAGQPWGVIL